MLSVILAIENEFDREFMSQLYLNYRRLMFHTVLKILNDLYSAEDVIQAAVVKLIDRVDLLKTMDTNHLADYIIVTCRKAAYNAVRDSSRQSAWVYDEETDLLASPETTPEQMLVESVDRNALLRVWPQLTERDRQLLRAKYVLQQKDDQIAKIFGIEPNSVRMALTRARRHALELINKER